MTLNANFGSAFLVEHTLTPHIKEIAADIVEQKRGDYTDCFFDCAISPAGASGDFPTIPARDAPFDRSRGTQADGDEVSAHRGIELANHHSPKNSTGKGGAE